VALASVGQVKTTKDWAEFSSGRGKTGLSTVGGGSGKISGLGGLAAGRTGQGGVGLIEDETEVVGGLDREVIAEVIRSKLGQILYCYERQLSANPDLYGKVSVKFTIGPSGQVESQFINDTTLKDKSVEGCILSRVASWKFPAPAGGTRVNVMYPFIFKSTN
ncbi:MAG: AgmX/PglI C-terminal domain-containing protein, partial [Bdellovibrionaceae bacterium]|nr:AgmX/PglI C-terminal domain-containing protein [Pseudobdellovibrionaceae bacterium]